MCLTFQCNYYIISRGLNICKFESHIKTFEDDIVIILKYGKEIFSCFFQILNFITKKRIQNFRIGQQLRKKFGNTVIFDSTT